MIQGTRLVLRGIEKTDLTDRQRWLNDPEIIVFFTNLGAIPLPYEKLGEWYDHVIHSDRELHFSVFLPDGTHIGGAQLKALDWKNRSVEFGMFIGEKSHWGKGYGTEITRLLVGYAFQRLNLHRVWLRVDPENIGAIRCYQKAGFQQEGVFHDEVFRGGRYHDSLLMRILEDEWRSARQG